MQTHDYLIPDYYPAFACKMGACRSACCEGWPISFSLEDYFRLTSQECGEALRRRIDTGLRVSLHPSPDAYAQISPRWDGNCPLRLEDGRCAVHAELGDGALACVCRLYPRGVRLERGYECSCANSCEAVLELLLHHPQPLRFIRRELSFDLPAPQPLLSLRPECVLEQEVRLWLIRLMQDRARPLPDRLMRLGLALRQIEPIRRDEAALRALMDTDFTAQPDSMAANEAHLAAGMATMEALMAQLDSRSDSVRRYGEAALAYFGTDDGAFDRYRAAGVHFTRLLPEWEAFFEHMLVNHMFFERFPFQDRPDSLWEEFVAICAVYALLRFLCLGWMAERDDLPALIDVCAAAFRLIDHTQFDRYASRTLHALGCTDPQRVHDLIIL